MVRERYRSLRWWAPLLVEPVEFINLVMSRRLLRGIKERAERAVVATRTSGSEYVGTDDSEASQRTRPASSGACRGALSVTTDERAVRASTVGA